MLIRSWRVAVRREGRLHFLYEMEPYEYWQEDDPLPEGRCGFRFTASDGLSHLCDVLQGHESTHFCLVHRKVEVEDGNSY